MATTRTAVSAEALLDEVERLTGAWGKSVSVEGMQAWIDAGETSAFTVAKWLNIDVRHPREVPEGLSVTDCLRLNVLDSEDPSTRWRTPTAETAQWAGLSGCCQIALRDLSRLGVRPGVLVPLVRALTGLGLGCAGMLPSREGTCGAVACPTPLTARLVLDAQDVVDLSDLSDLSTYLRAGFGAAEAIACLRAGRDMGPVRVLAALA